MNHSPVLKSGYRAERQGWRVCSNSPGSGVHQPEEKAIWWGDCYADKTVRLLARVAPCRFSAKPQPVTKFEQTRYRRRHFAHLKTVQIVARRIEAPGAGIARWNAGGYL